MRGQTGRGQGSGGPDCPQTTPLVRNARLRVSVAAQQLTQGTGGSTQGTGQYPMHVDIHRVLGVVHRVLGVVHRVLGSTGYWLLHRTPCLSCTEDKGRYLTRGGRKGQWDSPTPALQEDLKLTLPVCRAHCQAACGRVLRFRGCLASTGVGAHLHQGPNLNPASNEPPRTVQAKAKGYHRPQRSQNDTAPLVIKSRAHQIKEGVSALRAHCMQATKAGAGFIHG